MAVNGFYRRRVERRVVCISHATAAGGEAVGRLVADQLGVLCLDNEIVAQAAARAGVGRPTSRMRNGGGL